MKLETELLSKNLRLLKRLGENIKLARLRRRLTVVSVAERAGMSVRTLNHIEEGSPSVAIGYYLQALFILGLEGDFEKVALDDEFGRKLQDIGLKSKSRGLKGKKSRENEK